MQDLVVWTGPVNLQQAAGATVTGALAKAFPCVGALSTPLCSDFSWSLKTADGRRLPQLAARCGTSLDAVGDLFLGAFSAGGAVVRDLVSNEVDRARVRAVMLADATYSGAWVDHEHRTPLVNDFWIQWGERLANGPGDQLWVATASPSPNFDQATGVETLAEIRRQIELRTGNTFTKLDHFYGVSPGPEAAYQLGSIVFAEYPLDPLGHGGHVEIAGQVWQKILWPWLNRLRAGGGGQLPGQEPVEQPVELGGMMMRAGAAALGVLVGRAVVRAVWRG